MVPRELDKAVENWVGHASPDDLDQVIAVIANPPDYAAIEKSDGYASYAYAPEFLDPAIELVIGFCAIRDRELLAAKFHPAASSPKAHRGLIFECITSIQRPEYFRYLEEHGVGFEALTDDESLSFVWAVAYCGHQDSVRLLEKMRSRLQPHQDGAATDIDTCIHVARERTQDTTS